MLRKNVKFKSLYYIANLIYGVFSDIVLLYHAKIFHYLIAINSMASVAYMNRYSHCNTPKNTYRGKKVGSQRLVTGKIKRL